MLSHPFAPSKGVQDSLGFWTPRRGFWIPGAGFRSFVSETWIPDSVNCIPNSKAHDSRFHMKNFRIPESGFPCMRRLITGKGVFTGEIIAATLRCGDTSLREIAPFVLENFYENLCLRYNLAATNRTKSNQTEFVRLVAATKFRC